MLSFFKTYFKMKKIIAIALAFSTLGCQSKEKKSMTEVPSAAAIKNQNLETATLAGGCFWCTEAVFLEIEGVKSVLPGYIGGQTVNPTYEEISTGRTGHAEAIEIVFDPKVVSYGELLEIFFATHDPTTLNRQGADVGTQYRSEVFYHNDAQKKVTEEYIALLNLENTFGKPVVTKISAAPKFYVAEDYHKNYYSRNTSQSYCSYVITPKINKLKEKFQDKLKK
jgi:peptide-methionine (S)-S-oxide reductase